MQDITNPGLIAYNSKSLEIETDRLIIRSITIEDAQEYFKIVSDPETMKYIADGSIHSLKKAFKYIQECIEFEKATGYSRYAVTLKNTGAFIGFCGYKTYLGNVDLGWRYSKAFWNNGYGTEAAKALLEYGLNKLKFSKIVCIAYPGNIGSIKIMQKIGLVYKGKWQLPSGKEVERYENC